MDNTPSQSTSPQILSNQTDISAELAHINQEMYKKSFELAAKNKTLSLLRKIDEIILGSITNTKELSEQVVNILAAEEIFKLAGMYMWNEEQKQLEQLAFAESPDVTALKQQKNFQLQYYTTVNAAFAENILIKAVFTKQLQAASSIDTLILPNSQNPDVIQALTTATGIQSVLVYPFIVRNEVKGIMVLALLEKHEAISEYQADLLLRLIQGIGIALDNALLYSEVQQTNEQLKALDKLKDEFVSLASHELRTPMTAIKSYLWLILNDKNISMDEKQKQYLQRALISTDRLINLVNDMLNISRIESGRFTINQKPTDLVQLTKDVILEITPASQKQGNTIEFRPPAAPLPQVSADPDKIKEALINIIGNAIKFTQPGGKIIVSFVNENGYITTKVSDNGRGIAQEDIPKLFQKFQRIGEGSHYLVKQNVQGTGLGLYLTKSIVELHGGKILVTSEGVGKGSTFSFSLKTAA
jgi:signal transduction histidine kinase